MLENPPKTMPFFLEKPAPQKTFRFSFITGFLYKEKPGKASAQKTFRFSCKNRPKMPESPTFHEFVKNSAWAKTIKNGILPGRITECLQECPDPARQTALTPGKPQKTRKTKPGNTTPAPERSTNAQKAQSAPKITNRNPGVPSWKCKFTEKNAWSKLKIPGLGSPYI